MPNLRFQASFRPTIVAALLALLVGAVAGARTDAAESDAAGGARGKPNVVFILADDLGWTDLACQGSQYYQTPNIDKLAAAGMRFTNGYTCGPNCQPTRAALMSGQYGPRTGTYTVGSIDRFNWQSRSLRPVDNVQQLPLDRETIGDAMRKAGYVTGMFGKWHLGNDRQHHPSKRGFDEAIVSAGRHFKFKTDPRVEHGQDEYLADFLTDHAVDFLKRHKDESFFLYLPHFGVHSPFQAKKELIARFREKPAAGGHYDPTYAAMIASVDESVDRVVATLDELGLSDNTLVIFSSDNGGVGGYRRAGVDARSITDNAPLRGGKGMLYEGGIRVPYIFRWPGVISAGVISEVPINSVDLYPTLLELAGGSTPKQPLDGTSYLSVLKSGAKTADERGPLFWHFPGYLGSNNNTWRTTPGGVVRSGDWKLHEYFEDGRLELYNLREDLGEENNLAQQMPEKVKSLHKQLVAWRKKVNAPMPTPNEKPKQKKAAAVESAFHAVRCAGLYPGHLQGVCTNDRDAIYWAFTTVLVKTDLDGRVVKKIDVANHHGDLCFHDGKVYVAVNLGKFNLPPGEADSWVYVYDAETLDELARHPTPEVVHGAGGIAMHDNRFLVVGGLPIGYKENYLYEYGPDLKFRQRHVLDSGYTYLGIQTAAFADGAWWFGCYGTPKWLLKADTEYQFTGRWKLDTSLGIVGLPDGRLLIASGSRDGKQYGGALAVAVPDEKDGLRIVEPAPAP